MLESVYLFVGILAFVFLGLGLYNKKRSARLTLFAISMLLFGTAAIASLQVQMVKCDGVALLANQTNVTYSDSNNTITAYKNEILCKTNNYYDSGSAWLFGGFTLLAGFLTIVATLN